ncbi:hypothetical protein MNBD_GAMMA09-1655 [hydrothermal vent metagenome]|uniref:Uncharacterized protein n=1 Tax=hydrothermal vent metagenome TaxID=652676 RepID=A0A3B0YLS2_9ZZZZ
MKITARTQFHYRLQHIIFIILLLACIGVAGWLSVQYEIRSDWTAGKRHSLSDDTLQLLKQLPGEVNLRSYQPDEPALMQAVTEILSRYQNNKENFNFKLINPDIFIQQAKSDNIERYGQTIIEYQGRQERIEKLSEENISNALIRLHRNKKPQLLFVAQHGERNINDTSASGYWQLSSQLTTKGFETHSINLLQQPLTPGNSVLILSTVKQPLLASEQKKIIQYINEGGNLLWLQDPAPDDSLQAIADALSIEFIKGVVVDNNQEISRMLKLSHPAIIPILEYRRHPITEEMQYFTLFTSTTAIQDKTDIKDPVNTKWINTDLLITSDSSWSETGDILMAIAFNTGKDTLGPLSIGRAQQRQIKSTSGMSAQRIVIIGDSDFLANNQLGQGANLDFILKTFNWLAEDDKLITIAAKNAPDLQLKLSATTASITGLVFLVLLPLLLLACGGYIWRKRRRQ